MLLEAALENKEFIDSKFTNQNKNVKKKPSSEEVQMKVNALRVAS